MRVFLAVYKRGLKATLEYKEDFWVSLFSNLFAPLISLAVWLTIQQTNSNLPYNRTELIWYFVLVGLINNLTAAWHAPFLSEEIYNGDFSKYLVKHLSLFTSIIGNNLAEKTPRFFITVILLMILMYITRIDLSFSLEYVVRVILFMVAIAMSILINIQMQTAIGLLAFWVHDTTFVRSFTVLFSDFLSGFFVPIAFFPSILQTVATILPFRYIISFPAEILVGQLSPSSLILGFAMQITWCLAFYLIVKLVLNAGVRLYQGYGG